MNDNEIESRQLELEYRSFLDDEIRDKKYLDKVRKIIKEQETRLVVKINDLRKSPNFSARATGLIENSVQELIAFQRALKEFVISIDPTYGRSVFEFRIGLCGSFGSRHVTPRTLTSKFLNNTVCVEGIVSKVSLIKPRLVKSVLFCPATKKTIERRHYDYSSLDYQPNSGQLEKRDEDGNPLELEHGDSIYRDSQYVTLQEMPESAPAGQLPRCTDVNLDWDLVDKCKPGDRVQIVGSYRCLPNRQGNYTSCIFRTAVLANHVEQMSKEVAASLTDDDIKLCRRIRRRRNVVDQLASSLAPTIHGHQHVKKAILLQLLGGVEKNLKNGTRLRGDINLLLIGDPSVAKSQLLRFVLGIAPRAIATTGRGSSGVGLTAAVTTDPETGDRRLEAGAMVLADRGIVCVDEFDKMSDLDRTAIHEVMEQGRVTICKAGIQASLNARCSVLAAANPICGNYDPYKLPMDNIGLQDSLLSRFDLLFIMLDEHDRENDTKIAEHVSRIHRYRPLEELDGEPTSMNANVNHLTTIQDEDDDELAQTELYEKHQPLLHGNRPSRERFFSMAFLTKYLHVARKSKPQLSEQAAHMIGAQYQRLRTFDEELSDDSGNKMARTQPITARTLETLIRLSTAHAKARLSERIEEEDAAAAIDLIEFSIYRKVLDKPKPKRKPRENGEEVGDEEDADSEAHADDRQEPIAMDVDGDQPAAPAASSIVDESEMTRIRSLKPKFLECLNALSKERKGAASLDCDLIYQEAQTRLDFTRAEVDVLLALCCQSDDGLIDNNQFYFIN